MVQVLPNRKPPSIGERFSRALGGALESAEGLSNQYLAKQQEQQQQQALSRLIGMDLSGVSPDVQKLIVGERLKGQTGLQREMLKQGLQNQQEQDYLNQILGMAPGDQGETPFENVPGGDLFGTMNEPGTQKRGLQSLGEEKLQALLGTKRFKEPAKAELARRQKEKQQEEVYQLYKDAGFSDEEALQRAQSSSPATARTIFREKTEKPLFESEGEKLEAKRVAELATEIEKGYSTARNEDLRLGRMEELSKKGDVSTPAMMKVLDKLGLPVGILSNPDTEEYHKLETDFIREARDIFPGGRITNYEIQSYLKTIPTLMNSKEGREAIIHNRRLLNDAKKIRYDEYKKILKENGGKKPANMGILLDERIENKINDLEDQFREGLDSTLDKYSTKIKMYGQDGKVYEIPPHLIPQAQSQGLIFR